MNIGNIEVFLQDLNCWVPTHLSTLFNNFNSEEDQARLPENFKLTVKEKQGKIGLVSEVVVSDYYEIQRIIIPSNYFFKDKIQLIRENEDLDKQLLVYCVGKIISKDNRQCLVEYDNFLHEIELVDNSILRPLTKSFSSNNLMIKWINLNHLINLVKTNDTQNLSFLNKLSFSDILNEVFNQKNNYLELLAIESIKLDVFMLGTPEDLILAQEMLLLKIYSKITLNEKNNEIIQEKSKLERINNILNCENKRTFKFSKKFTNIIKQILDKENSKASYFIEENSDNDLVTIVLFSENEDDLNNLSRVLDLEEDTLEISQSFEESFLQDNSNILNELKEKSNIIDYSTEKNSDLLKIHVLGEKNTIDNFKQSIKLQMFYFEKYEKINKESKVTEPGYGGIKIEYTKTRKPRVQNTFNYKNKY